MRKPGADANRLTKRGWERQHDTASRTIRLTHSLALTFSLYCAITLSAPDALLLDKNATLPLPIAGTSTSYSMFLLIAPLIHTAFFIHLQIAFGYLRSLKRRCPDAPDALPFIFNLHSVPARAISFLLIYALTPLNLFFFVWKASPLQSRGYWLLLLTLAVSFTSALLWMARAAADVRPRVRFAVLWTMAALGLVCESLVACGTIAWRRPLDLTRAVLTDRVFEKVDLSNSTLAGADLSRSSLIDVDLRNSNLSAARLFDSNLHNVDLRNATLTGATFVGVKGEGVLLSASDCAGCAFKSTTLKGGAWTGVDCSGCTFENVSLSHTTLSGASLRGAVLKGGSTFDDVELHEVTFERARLTQVTFRFTYLSDVSYHSATLENVTFESCTFLDSNFELARLTNVRVQGCYTEGLKLNGIDGTLSYDMP